MEFILIFSNGTVQLMNTIEEKCEGNLFLWIAVMALDIHGTLGGFLIEDLIFRDIDKLGGIIKNIDFYISYIILVPMFWIL